MVLLRTISLYAHFVQLSSWWMLIKITMKYKIFCLCLCAFYLEAGSQTTTHAWGSVFMNGPYKKSWGLHLDAQVRSAEQSRSVKSWLIRAGLQRKLNTRHSLALGYAYVWTQTIAAGFRSHQPEHRIWQQWLYQHPLLGSTLQHRFRLEERFIGNGQITEGSGIAAPALYSTRLRYFNRLLLPVGTSKPFEQGPFVALQNEVFLNVTGKSKLNGYIYDQNRLYIAGGYRINRRLDLELGYMRRHLRLRSTNSHQHIWQLVTYLRPD